MSIEENKALVRRYLSADAETVRQDYKVGRNDYHSPESLVHTSNGDWNLKEYDQFMDMLVEAFPDLKYSAKDIIAEGDKVVCRYGMTVTNTGSLRGMSLTEKSSRLEE